MGDLPNLPVTVVTDWNAIYFNTYVLVSIAVLSAFGTVAGVYFGIKWSMKSFYSQKWWEKRADAYILVLKELEKVFRSAVSIIKFYKSGDTDPRILKPLEEIFRKNLDTLEHEKYINSIFFDKDTNDILIDILNRSIIDNGAEYGTREHFIKIFEQICKNVSKAKIEIELNMHKSLNVSKDNNRNFK